MKTNDYCVVTIDKVTENGKERTTIALTLEDARYVAGVCSELNLRRMCGDAKGADKLQEDLAGLWLDAMWRRKEDWE